MTMIVEETFTISGRGLLAVGIPDGIPVQGACSITLPGGELIAGYISGIELFASHKLTSKVCIVLRGLISLEKGVVIRQ